MRLAQPSFMPLRQRIGVVITKWRRLIDIACHPYRPEFHYMRGPGPKWHEKHPPRPNS